ncbi:MAG TPA: ABC transporter ATP-binding protein [Gaiellales bacterium]
MSLLAVDSVDAGYGLLQAVRGVSLALAEGETVALVGANGAGKTTLLRTIAGAHQAAAGTVSLAGRDVTRVSAHRRVALGIALVPEGRRLFPGLTVEENLRMGAATRRAGRWDLDSVLAAFPMLAPLRKRRAANLSGGEQQATAIGRALMSNPIVLLLDEVSLGLSPIAVEAVYESLRTVVREGTTALLVEQDLDRALGFADRVVCMLEGRVVLEDRAEPAAREKITAAYFGLSAAGAGGGAA